MRTRLRFPVLLACLLVALLLNRSGLPRADAPRNDETAKRSAVTPVAAANSPAGPEQVAAPGAGPEPAQTPEARLRYALSRDPGLLKVITTTDGERVLALNGTHSTAAAARRMADGSIRIACFESYEALDAFVTGTDVAAETQAATRRALK